MKRDTVQLIYKYDLTDEGYCMPLYTEGEKTIITVKMEALILFSTYPELVQSGEKRVRHERRVINETYS